MWVADAGDAGPPPDALPSHAGGQVATAMLALARLGARTAWAGALGDDAAADLALAPLRAAGVDCEDAQRVAGGATRRALVRVDRASGDRVVTPERDPGVRVDAAALARERIAGARALLVDAEDPPASLAAVRIARAAGRCVVLDADAEGPGVGELVAASDFPIVSRPLADALGRGSVEKGLRVLAAQARSAAVVTLGEQGAIAAQRGSDVVIESPAFRVVARDTTGAGDAFHAGFVWAWLGGESLVSALRTASAVAALNCEALGAQGGLPDRERLERFLRARAGDPGGEAK